MLEGTVLVAWQEVRKALSIEPGKMLVAMITALEVAFIMSLLDGLEG